MASLLTVDDVLRGVLGEEGDSDSNFDGYTSGEDDSGVNGGGDQDGGDQDGGDSRNGGSAGGDGNGSSSSGIPRYLHQRGCTTDMSNRRPVDFFHLFVTDGMLEEIVTETNLYAQQYLDTHDLLPTSRLQQWKSAQHDIVELKKYLALVIGMGIVNLPRVEDAWVTTWPFTSSAFSGIMSRNRFSLVMRFLHLNDSRG